jgi:hypothetical protein
MKRTIGLLRVGHNCGNGVRVGVGPLASTRLVAHLRNREGLSPTDPHAAIETLTAVLSKELLRK